MGRDLHADIRVYCKTHKIVNTKNVVSGMFIVVQQIRHVMKPKKKLLTTKVMDVYPVSGLAIVYPVGFLLQHNRHNFQKYL